MYFEEFDRKQLRIIDEMKNETPILNDPLFKDFFFTKLQNN